MNSCKHCNTDYSIKWYKGKTQCRNCYKKSIYQYKTKPQNIKQCINCNESMIDKSFHQGKKFCSDSCSRKNNREYKVTENQCKECDNCFISNREKQFCNVKCYSKMFKRTRELSLLEKMKKNIRSRLHQAMKNNVKSAGTIELLGCSIIELKTHLESKFTEGMSWDNYGVSGWHIDHIKPLSSFDLSNPNQLREACNYTNLQPLWAKENLSKGNKYEER